MLIKNLPGYGLVNGSVGIVIGFACTAELAGNESGKISFDKIYEHEELGAVEVASIPTCESERRRTMRLGRPGGIPLAARAWPVVRFQSGRQLLIPAADFTVDNCLGEAEAVRYQVPLILAYSLTIHKSQGQTIERVVVDMGDMFESGQAYVALSRAVSLSSLQILRFNANKIYANPKVVRWYSKLSGGQPEEPAATSGSPI